MSRSNSEWLFKECAFMDGGWGVIVQLNVGEDGDGDEGEDGDVDEDGGGWGWG